MNAETVEAKERINGFLGAQVRVGDPQNQSGREGGVVAQTPAYPAQAPGQPVAGTVIPLEVPSIGRVGLLAPAMASTLSLRWKTLFPELRCSIAQTLPGQGTESPGRSHDMSLYDFLKSVSIYLRCREKPQRLFPSLALIRYMNASEEFSQDHAGHQQVEWQRPPRSPRFMPTPVSLQPPYTLAPAKTACSWVELEAAEGRMDEWLESPLVTIYQHTSSPGSSLGSS